MHGRAAPGRRIGCWPCCGRSTWARRPTRISTGPWTICRPMPARPCASLSTSAATTTRSYSNGGTGSFPGTHRRRPAPRRMTEHRDYVAMLRRRQFFERRDENWKEMLPYRTYDEFWKLVTGQTAAALHRDKLLLAINRGEGLSDPKRLGDALALRVRLAEQGTVRSYRLFPGERFSLELPAASNHRFVEHVPQALRLVYAPPGGQPAELVVDLDIFEMLSRLMTDTAQASKSSKVTTRPLRSSRTSCLRRPIRRYSSPALAMISTGSSASPTACSSSKRLARGLADGAQGTRPGVSA